MADEIAPILSELRSDHRNMDLLLKLLDRESETIFAGQDADLELIRDIMLYMTAFPDAVHHPNEDRLYAELKAVRPDLASGMSRISLEHSQIAEHGLVLREKVEQIIAGDPVSRIDIVARTSRYSEYLRSHMHWEEKDLFRRIEKMVADGHSQIDTSVIIRARDPVFSDEVSERFATLLENIRIAQSSSVESRA